MKAGAMFGLDSRMLRKQFWELFLARRHSAAPKGVVGSSSYSKRGAMFGLDARIALAIFGALSVISGAALYSAIQQSKVVSIVTELQEVTKAYEAFFLDTGVGPGENGGVWIDAKDLVEKPAGVLNWNGPYFSSAVSGNHIEHLIYGDIGLARSISADHGGTSIGGHACTSTDCHLYSFISDVPTNLAKAVDLYIDGIDTVGTGNLRYYSTGSGISTIVYKVGPYLH